MSEIINAKPIVNKVQLIYYWLMQRMSKTVIKLAETLNIKYVQYTNTERYYI